MPSCFFRKARSDDRAFLCRNPFPKRAQSGLRLSGFLCIFVVFNIERENVSSRIKKLAAKILTEEFADFRYCREPEKIEEQLQQIQTPETEDFQENSNKPKMKI